MKVLIIGAGIGGMAATIALRRAGADVHVVDIDPLWRVYGAGITITGATLRAFQDLGVYDEIASRGYVGDGIQVCDVSGRPIADLLTPMPADAGVAGCGGIMRPVLHKILSARVRESGANVGLGISVEKISQDDEGVDIHFSDGSTGRYDLVIGADGIYSRTRDQILADAPKPEYTGQSVWRIVTDRPVGIDRRHYFLGGEHKVGFTPVSPEEMYLFIVERTPQEFREPDQLYDRFRALLADYGGVVADIRSKVTPATEIVFRPLETFHLPAPWHVGSVVLIGDAAHPTTPQLASGAGIAVEDALVLAQEVSVAPRVKDALERFTERREHRCRLVVESSIEIGRLEQAGAPPEAQTAVVARALAALSEPI